MEVRVVRIDFAHVGDVVVVVFFGRRDDVHTACVLGFLDRFRGPRSGVGVGRLATFRQEVHGRRQKRQAGPALEVQDVKAVGQSKEFLGQRTAFLHGGNKGLAAVGHFDQRQAMIVPRFHSLGGLFQHFLRQDAWACGKIVHVRHGYGLRLNQRSERARTGRTPERVEFSQEWGAFVENGAMKKGTRGRASFAGAL